MSRIKENRMTIALLKQENEDLKIENTAYQFNIDILKKELDQEKEISKFYKNQVDNIDKFLSLLPGRSKENENKIFNPHERLFSWVANYAFLKNNVDIKN